jgi:hypothetical protein
MLLLQQMAPTPSGLVTTQWWILVRDELKAPCYPPVSGIATGYGLGDRGVGARFPMESIIVFSSRRPDRLWGPRSLLFSGYRGDVSPGLKRQGREADHLPPTSAEVKKLWIYTSTPLYAFMA